MQVPNLWAEPVIADSYDENNTEQTTSIQNKRLSTGNIFPPQRVEPVDMPRTQSANRDKKGYTQSSTNTTDDHLSHPIHVPLKRVKHPTEQLAIIIFFKRLWKICLGLLISFPCVIFITFLLPISWLIRTFIRFTCRYHCTVSPCTCTYLSASDLFWLYNSKKTTKNEETTKLNHRTITPVAAAIFFLEGTVNENSLKKILLNRLISNTSRRGSHVGEKLFPRFSQIIHSHFSGTMWIDYSAFSIDEHVREIPRPIQTDEDLQSYVSSLLSSDLSLTRPLWQLHYKNRSNTRPNDSILIFIYHPVLSDGISLIRILLKHIVDNRTTQLDLKARFAGRHGEHIFDYVKAYFFGHMLLFSKLFFNSSPSSNHFLQNLSHPPSTLNTCFTHPSQRIVYWSTPFSLTQANRMKLVTRTRMNDLLCTLIISSVKLYMEKHGINNFSHINCIMPCDLRSNTPNILLGNHIAHLPLNLPMNIEGNIPLLWSFNEHTKQFKDNADYATMYLFTNITYLLFPRCLANRIISRVYDDASVWLTSISAGSSTPLATMSICNRDVRSLICLNPSIGRQCVNFCVTTYADEIRLAVVVDPNLIPNPQFLTDCFHEQFLIVQELLAHRRIPGEIRRIIRPPRFPLPKKSISSISEMSDDLTIEEIQSKMTTLQQELLSLKSQFENVDMNDPASQNQRLIITSKLEELRREFRELLIKLQERQCELSGMIPSDEEDEMDPDIRVRLRSASVASKISLRSNEQRQLSSRIYQLDRDDASEYSATVVHTGVPMGPNSISSSKMSIAGQSLDSGMRRAQSVSICESTRVDTQRRTSLTRTRPLTPAKTPVTTMTTNATIVHFNPSEH